jgi:hypothetical protein
MGSCDVSDDAEICLEMKGSESEIY